MLCCSVSGPPLPLSPCLHVIDYHVYEPLYADAPMADAAVTAASGGAVVASETHNDFSASAKVFMNSAGTLIVSPISIVYQWKAEISKHAPSLSVCICLFIYLFYLHALSLFPSHVLCATFQSCVCVCITCWRRS